MSEDADVGSLRDQDLIDRLNSVRGKPGAATMLRVLQEQQEERDRMGLLSPVARRRAETRKQLEAEKLEHDDRHHIHSVLALCGLPYRQPQASAREFIREYGRNSLVVQAGFVKDPNTGKMTAQGLPYGPKARLLMLHICTMAVRQKSATIEIADSMSAFIRELGFPVTGGKKGTLPQFKEQLNRLAASRMQIGLWNGDRTTTVNSQPIRSFDVWLPTNPDQKLLWSSELRLDEEFYTSLREHALPVDMRSLRAFSQSAKQIDMVLWLGYRLRNLKRAYAINWATLHDQFGADVQSARKFRHSFIADLKEVQEVFPNLSVLLQDDGLLLKPSDPDRLFVPTRRTVLGVKS